MKKSLNEKGKKKKVLTKRKKSFKDPFLRDLKEKPVKKSSLPIQSTKPIKTDTIDELVTSRTQTNKAQIARLLPKTRLQLPTHALRSARTFAQCPSMSVVSRETLPDEHRQLPIVCSRAALNFHARRLGTNKRADNDYRLGQINKRRAGKIIVEKL